MSGYKTESQERETNEQIIVYVSGAVNRPGVVELPLDARVNDALQAAGGPQENADINLVNLAQTISDGAQIHVPVKGEPALGEPSPGVQQGQGVRGSKGQTVAGSAGAENPEGSRQKVNLNTATVEQLDQIPGIGAITAREILNWRAQNGPFQSLEDLLQVSRIGQKTLEKLRPYLTL
ncbi:helix-hairpin-helix domain-containing protein [Arcanobacterium hippocoleae]